MAAPPPAGARLGQNVAVACEDLPTPVVATVVMVIPGEVRLHRMTDDSSSIAQDSPHDVETPGEVEVPASAWGVGALLACEHGLAAQYRATLEGHGPAYVTALVTKLLRADLIRDQVASNGWDRHALFLILDESGFHTLESYDIISHADFKHLREMLGMRGDFDCDKCAQRSPYRGKPNKLDKLLRGLVKRLPE